MGLLSSMSGSAFDPLVDKATSEENTSEDWALIMEICDRTTAETGGTKECLRSIVRRLNSPIPGVVMQALTLVDALVNNCGKKFHLEVCSRDFETELRRLVGEKTSPHPKVAERSRQLVKKWAHEFRSDSQLNLIPSLYEKLKSEGMDFSSSDSSARRNRVSDAVLKNPDAVSSNQEEADIAKAIELSLREAQKGSGGKSSAKTSHSTSNTPSSLYPTFDLQPTPTTPKELFKVRALYDFEAAEDNELTFKAGEIILVQDNSDANWWKGSNHRGEGLFPANFVSTDLSSEPEPICKKVQFNDEVNVKVLDKDSNEQPSSAPVVIDENKIDRLIHLLQEADPQSDKRDSDELLTLEEQCVSMMPLIDQEIELIDKQHAALSSLNRKLNSSLNLYHELMKQNMMAPMLMNNATSAYPGPVPLSSGYPPYQANGVSPYDPSAANPDPGSYAVNGYYPSAVMASQPQPYPPPQSLQYSSGIASTAGVVVSSAGVYPSMYATCPATGPYPSGAASAIAPTYSSPQSTYDPSHYSNGNVMTSGPPPSPGQMPSTVPNLL